MLYSYNPWFKIGFYLFTICFHVYMLLKALIDARYLTALILLIPVTAVSIALVKYVKKAVVKVISSDAGIELRTLIETAKFWYKDIRVEGKKLITADGRYYLLRHRGATKLLRVIEENLYQNPAS